VSAPKTLGGWVIQHHGIRTWWHVQRCLMTWGMPAVALGRRPTREEVMQGAGVSSATYYRDVEFFHTVFPDRDPYEFFVELWEGRERRRYGAVDVVLDNRWAVGR
jgi:hypothetical protein